jgi:sterol desaturase/sphingolipid hydroxylase (fatty acid hydroxylase superfamily)
MCQSNAKIDSTPAHNNISITAEKMKNVENSKSSKPQDVYSWVHPDETLKLKDHFSSLLFGGSIANTLLELIILIAPFIADHFFNNVNSNSSNNNNKAEESLLNVKGSMPFKELAIYFVICSIVRRVYNAYLEAVYFSFPKLRTQPPNEHRLKQKKDLMGRDIEQLERIDWHDKGTMLSQFILNFGLYFLLPGFYPVATEEEQSMKERFLRLLINHYVMSFGMYWAHRSLHDIAFLWRHIHSFHHWAKHPLSRNTYEDHWLDNFMNAIIGHAFAQILVPLDRPTFYFSHIFRIFESLEKHSGVSCGFNVAHSLQQWLPFAQMPHHHDWHHEGFKGSNFTFSSIGGIWDCLFGTRKGGRYMTNKQYAATREDKSKHCNKFDLPNWFNPLFPLVGLSIAVGIKLNADEVF